MLIHSILQLIVDATRTPNYNIENDVVVITGGSSGFGYELSKEFTRRRLAVAVLDIAVPEFEVAGVKYYLCDVRDNDEVIAVLETVRREVCNIDDFSEVGGTDLYGNSWVSLLC